jgi:hypothetical protein
LLLGSAPTPSWLLFGGVTVFGHVLGSAPKPETGKRQQEQDLLLCAILPPVWKVKSLWTRSESNNENINHE